MAGSLILIDEFTTVSPVSSVYLGAGSSGSSGNNAVINSDYNVYQVVIDNWTQSSLQSIGMRVTSSEVAKAGTVYNMRAVYFIGSAFTLYSTNDINTAYASTTIGDASGERGSVVLYLFNFNNVSQYSYWTWESVHAQTGAGAIGQAGGGVYEAYDDLDGVNFYGTNGYTFEGNFRLYGLRF